MGVYYPPQVLIIDWFLEIGHKGSRLKVPFAVTCHILSKELKNSIKLKVGQVVLELLIQTTF